MPGPTVALRQSATMNSNRVVAFTVALGMLIVGCSAGGDAVPDNVVGNEIPDTSDPGGNDAQSDTSATPTVEVAVSLSAPINGFDPDAAPNPASIAVDGGAAVAASIGPAGGTLAATGAGGTEYGLVDGPSSPPNGAAWSIEEPDLERLHHVLLGDASVSGLHCGRELWCARLATRSI
jgi:hypothetical protein